jgi:hypothetical protein
MEKLYIHHHLGLGDYFVCNSIVRLLYKKKCFSITLAVKYKNFFTVKSLYQDIDINYHIVGNDADCESNYKFFDKYLRLGFENCNINSWESSFYDQVGLNYSVRYAETYIPKNLDSQIKLFNDVILEKKYAFCNTKCSEGIIDLNINTKLPKIFLEEKTENILDWVKIIENASEIHTIDSSIFQLIKNLKLKSNKFFYDIRDMGFARTNFTFEDNNWNLIK